jgi:hypothetical protein
MQQNSHRLRDPFDFVEVPFIEAPAGLAKEIPLLGEQAQEPRISFVRHVPRWRSVRAESEGSIRPAWTNASTSSSAILNVR